VSDYAKRQDEFARLRVKLGKIHPRPMVDLFFRTPQAELSGRSPGRAIHDDEAHKVEAIIDRMAANLGPR
jgi:hypothetical protein